MEPYRGRRIKTGEIEESIFEKKVQGEIVIYRQSSSILPARPLGAPLTGLFQVNIKIEREDEESVLSNPSSSLEFMTAADNPVVSGRMQNLSINTPPESSAEENSPIPAIERRTVDWVENLNPSDWNAEIARINNDARSLSPSPAGHGRPSSTETVLADESQQVPSLNIPFFPLTSNCRPDVVIKSETECDTYSSESGQKRPSDKTCEVNIKRVKKEIVTESSKTYTDPETYENSFGALSSESTQKRPSDETCEVNIKRVKKEIFTESSETYADPETYENEFGTLSSESSLVSNLPTRMFQDSKKLNAKWNESIHTSTTPLFRTMNQSFLASTPKSATSACERVFKFLKYKNLISEINRTEIEECLYYLKKEYPQTERFSLFNCKKPLQAQSDDVTRQIQPVYVPLEMRQSADELLRQPVNRSLEKQPLDSHYKPVATNSSELNLSGVDIFSSKESLRKIIEKTSLLQNQVNDTSNKGHLFVPNDICSSSTTFGDALTATSHMPCELDIKNKSETVTNAELNNPMPCSSKSSDSRIKKRTVAETIEKSVKKLKNKSEYSSTQNVLVKINFCKQAEKLPCNACHFFHYP